VGEIDHLDDSCPSLEVLVRLDGPLSNLV